MVWWRDYLRTGEFVLQKNMRRDPVSVLFASYGKQSAYYTSGLYTAFLLLHAVPAGAQGVNRLPANAGITDLDPAVISRIQDSAPRVLPPSAVRPPVVVRNAPPPPPNPGVT